FRVEEGLGDPDESHRVKLSGYEIATRLSFLLLGAGPDDALLDAAEGGELETADQVEEAARALLDAGRAAAPLATFTDEWLELGVLATVERDPLEYPAYDDALRASMAEETRRFVAELVSTDGDMLDLVDARWTYLDDALAALYGVAPPPSPWAKTTLGEGDHRVGLLTQASVLTL